MKRLKNLAPSTRSTRSTISVALLAVAFTSINPGTAHADPTDAQFQAMAAAQARTIQELNALESRLAAGGCKAATAATCIDEAEKIKVANPTCTKCVEKANKILERLDALPLQTADAVWNMFETKYGAQWRQTLANSGGECVSMLRIASDSEAKAPIDAGIVSALTACGERAKLQREKAIAACQENGGVVSDAGFTLVCDKPNAEVIQARSYGDIAKKGLDTAQAMHRENGGGAFDFSGQGLKLKLDERKSWTTWKTAVVVVAGVAITALAVTGAVCGATENCINKKDTTTQQTNNGPPQIIGALNLAEPTQTLNFNLGGSGVAWQGGGNFAFRGM